MCWRGEGATCEMSIVGDDEGAVNRYNEFKEEIEREDLTEEQKETIIRLLDNDIAHYGKNL